MVTVLVVPLSLLLLLDVAATPTTGFVTTTTSTVRRGAAHFGGQVTTSGASSQHDDLLKNPWEAYSILPLSNDDDDAPQRIQVLPLPPDYQPKQTPQASSSSSLSPLLLLSSIFSSGGGNKKAAPVPPLTSPEDFTHDDSTAEIEVIIDSPSSPSKQGASASSSSFASQTPTLEIFDYDTLDDSNASSTPPTTTPTPLPPPKNWQQTLPPTIFIKGSSGESSEASTPPTTLLNHVPFVYNISKDAYDEYQDIIVAGARVLTKGQQKARIMRWIQENGITEEFMKDIALYTGTVQDFYKKVLSNLAGDALEVYREALRIHGDNELTQKEECQLLQMLFDSTPPIVRELLPMPLSSPSTPYFFDMETCMTPRYQINTLEDLTECLICAGLASEPAKAIDGSEPSSTSSSSSGLEAPGSSIPIPKTSDHPRPQIIVV